MNLKLHAQLIIGISLMAFLGGCQKQELEPEPESVGSDVTFTLTATYGGPETKLTFDEDGLGTTWQPGDKLYLVDVAGKNKTVTLTTSITAPSKKASFKSTTSVLSGEYVVLYGSVTDKVKTSWKMFNAKSLNDHIILYGALSVTDGQTSANISLSHAYARLTFKFKNIPAGLKVSDMGMAASKSGLNCTETHLINQTGFSEVVAQAIISFGWSVSDDFGCVTIAPLDLSSKKVYFYINGTDADGKFKTYEFIKEGIKIKEGINYNIVFDFNSASNQTILNKSLKSTDAYVLTKPTEFRAAAYWNNEKNSYSVESDVDFNGEAYFPIRAEKLYGHKHILSNIVVDLEKCDNVGVLSKGTSDSLCIKNVSIKGHDNVGGLAGVLTGKNSGCCGKNIKIVGNDNTGGLYGYAELSSSYSYIEGCTMQDENSVSGCQYVGGIIGHSDISSSVQKNPVISNCGYEGDVSGERYIGGIVGCMNSDSRCDCKVDRCYVKGDISGSDKCIGGILGDFISIYCYVENSYIIGDVIGDSYKTVGGIIGHEDPSNFYDAYCGNCYSNGHVSSNYGVAHGYKEKKSGASNLTSSPYLNHYDNYGDRYNCNCGPDKTFLSLLSVINGDEAYSTQVWKGIDAQCPLLQWQADLLNGDIEAPGFGNEDW